MTSVRRQHTHRSLKSKIYACPVHQHTLSLALLLSLPIRSHSPSLSPPPRSVSASSPPPTTPPPPAHFAPRRKGKERKGKGKKKKKKRKRKRDHLSYHCSLLSFVATLLVLDSDQSTRCLNTNLPCSWILVL